LRGMFEQSAEPASLAVLEAACRAFAKGGARIVEGPLPPGFAGVLEAQHCIMAAEAAAVHRIGFAERPQLYPPRITAIIREGLGTAAVDLVAAQEQRRRMIAELAPLLAEVDVALTPSTVGPAPTPETTGPRIFQAPWSHAGLPTLTLPAGLAPDGLPLGVQLIASAGLEDDLFSVAAWCEKRLGFAERPA
jgi:aspartyl-tRNA(Asn)/glutamyl-tRNA(Gln) amidotransferase subunit A